MPILKNARHEKFAQELATGKTAAESYVLAGFKPSRKNASRLRANEDISARVAELQGIAARSAVITIESICRELDQANQIAMANGQASAMVSASTLRAKLAGLLKDRVEVTAVNAFEACESTEAVVDRLLEELIIHFAPVDQRDREGLIELLDRQGAETIEYLDAIRARPHVAERVDLAKLPSDWRNTRPSLPRLIGNGRQR